MTSPTVSLQQLQTLFMDAMFKNPDNPAVNQLGQLLSDNKQLTAEEQITIYRNSVIGCMIHALRQTYPVCNRLVGDEFFDAMAKQFIYKNPSLSPDLGDYGQSFADFISDFEPAEELVYLPDVARLEWAWEKAFGAIDHQGLDLQAFSQLDAQQQSALHFHLPPGSCLIASAYPITKIWQINQDDYQGNEAISLDEGDERLLVWRQGFDMRIDSLNDDEWRFLSAIQQDRAFIDICELFAEDESVSVEALLPTCVQRGWIADFTLTISEK